MRKPSLFLKCHAQLEAAAESARARQRLSQFILSAAIGQRFMAVFVAQGMKASGGLVSIVSSPHAGRLEGASDRPEFEAIKPKTAPVATHCAS